MLPVHYLMFSLFLFEHQPCTATLAVYGENQWRRVKPIAGAGTNELDAEPEA